MLDWLINLNMNSKQNIIKNDYIYMALSFLFSLRLSILVHLELLLLSILELYINIVKPYK